MIILTNSHWSTLVKQAQAQATGSHGEICEASARQWKLFHSLCLLLRLLYTCEPGFMHFSWENVLFELGSEMVNTWQLLFCSSSLSPVSPRCWVISAPEGVDFVLLKQTRSRHPPTPWSLFTQHRQSASGNWIMWWSRLLTGMVSNLLLLYLHCTEFTSSNPFTPKSDKLPEMTSHHMKNLAFHCLLRWNTITTNSHYITIHFSLKGWENVLCELGYSSFYSQEVQKVLQCYYVG